MAGGPIFPNSVFPSSANVYPDYSASNDAGVGVVASLAANAIAKLRFLMPPVLPAGTAKLRVQAQAPATSGSAKVNPKWNMAGNGDDPAGVTLNAEGTTTITWSTGETNKYKVTKIDLDASTIQADKTLVMDFTFETSGWTLAADSVWTFAVIWE